MLGGRQVYAKLFHADIKADGPIRRNRPLILTGLSKTGEAPGRLVKDMTIRLEKGRLPLETPRPEDGVIQSMVEALRNAGAATDDERIAAAIMAAGTAPLPQPANDCPPEPPVSSSQPMLEATTAKQEGDEGEGVAPGPGTRGDRGLSLSLTGIEQAAGATPEDAARIGREAAGLVAEASRLDLPEPPAMEARVLADKLRQWIQGIAA